MVERVFPTRPPSRRIPLSRRSHIIGFQPLATGTAAHESTLERDFVTVTSFVDPSAIIASQRITISFIEASLRRRYTPDFLVTRSGTLRADLIEVKYAADLRENWTRLAPAFEAARLWARQNNATFRIVTEYEIRGPLLNNAKRLLPLRRVPLDTKMARLALTAFIRLNDRPLEPSWQRRIVQKTNRHSSGCCAMVIVEHPAETLAPLHGVMGWAKGMFGLQQSVSQPLMITLSVIVHHEMPDRVNGFLRTTAGDESDPVAAKGHAGRSYPEPSGVTATATGESEVEIRGGAQLQVPQQHH
jgi:hypothetical protein